jgi:hypothetical protein
VLASPASANMVPSVSRVLSMHRDLQWELERGLYVLVKASLSCICRHA